ncbi:hypothetical protein GCM10010211_82110 [Streptomyces albospinus]|uniref:Uncharacterized protein n=1 Tax=Streptomyces albospinus TaxID=285515 RepID=A0ABQ2VS25_9ACTN|nr:hypothetical protein [Streptomyces albospinus]GGV02357.1 hypothetical protein GCM10010211_82110 [Streptomyces albospinus]
MARRTEYDEGQAAKRLKVPAAAFRWARNTGLVPAPDAPSWQWSRAAVEAMDADAVRAAMPRPPISGGVAADRVAAALGTPNASSKKAKVASFVVRRFIDRGPLTELSANPDGSLLHPGQVSEVCQREDLAAPAGAAARRPGSELPVIGWSLSRPPGHTRPGLSRQRRGGPVRCGCAPHAAAPRLTRPSAGRHYHHRLTSTGRGAL